MKTILFILLQVNLLFAMTFSELETTVRYMLKDSETPYRFSQALIMDMANRGQEDILRKTWCLDSRIKTDITTNTTEYFLPDDVFKIVRVTINNKAVPEFD